MHPKDPTPVIRQNGTGPSREAQEIKKKAPELAAKVRSGEMTLSQAKTQAPGGEGSG
jgi:hypothetical protein